VNITESTGHIPVVLPLTVDTRLALEKVRDHRIAKTFPAETLCKELLDHLEGKSKVHKTIRLPERKRMTQLNLFPGVSHKFEGNKKEKKTMAEHPIKEGSSSPTPKQSNPNPGQVQRREHDGGFQGSKQLGVRYPGHEDRRDNPDATEGSGGGGE